jgi:hypothetical protein
MNRTIVLLFAIPVLCIIIIVVNQFWDEMFKKKFVIERRKGSAADRGTGGSPTSPNRRYNDPGYPAATSEATPEQSSAKGAQGFETSTSLR